MIGTVFDGLNDASDFSLYFRNRAPSGRVIDFSFAGEATELGVKFFDKGGDEFGRHHSLAQTAQNPFLNLSAVN